MENLVIVATFTYPTELAVIRGRLESEGIECFLKDEYTVQAYNFYSNAIGGIKLQVRESDAERAIQILKEAGYIKEQDQSPSPFFSKLDKLTNKMPFIGKLSIELRYVILAAFILVVLSLIGFLVLSPGAHESY